MLKPQDLEWSGQEGLSRSASWEGFHLYIQLQNDDTTYYVAVTPPASRLERPVSEYFSSPGEAAKWACKTAEELRSMSPGEEYHRRQKLLRALDDCLGIKPGVSR
jgi:hypothetical protein